jgi:hypothetical protein
MVKAVFFTFIFAIYYVLFYKLFYAAKVAKNEKSSGYFCASSMTTPMAAYSSKKDFGETAISFINVASSKLKKE